MNTVIKAEHLTKRYGEKTAVDDLVLEIGEGELFSLLGVNGAGKTTTIRMLTGLSRPDAGRAEIFGRDLIRDRDQVKEMVGLSTQDTAVARRLTVSENLRFMAGIYGKSKERADRVLSEFGLKEVAGQKAGNLSGGWSRRLSIAMAVIGEPRVLFLDEPTLGLDVLARRDLWNLIGEMKKETTIILTTHYMEEAEALSDRIGIMVEGRISAKGTLEDLRRLTGEQGLEEIFIRIAEEERKHPGAGSFRQDKE